MDKEKVKKKLEKILGAERVFCDEKTLQEFSSDMTENESKTPDFVVKSKKVSEICEIVKLANQEKIPLIPAVARTNLGGLTIATEGGIILDLREMNKIIEINEKEMYAIIEPGVTLGDMKEYLEKNYPDLRFGYPMSPPYTSIVANCLLDGLANLSFKYGPTSEWINGLEVVLPNGELLKTGSCALSPYWFSRAPLPDLTGLFISWQGSTGIITKMSVQLFPKPKYRLRMFLMCYELNTAYSLMREFSKTFIFDDIGGLSWTTAKMLLGIERPMHRDEDEPDFFVYLEISGNTRRELWAKQAITEEVVQNFKRKKLEIEGPLNIELLIKVDPLFAKFADFPTYLDFMLDHKGGGLTWVGTYGPTSQWEEGTKKGIEILKKYNFSPTFVSRPMKGGHFGVLRFIILFDKKNKEEVKDVKKANNEICDLILDLGFIPYKAPAWAVKKFKERIDKNYYELLSQIKKLLDPNRIMNPGRWLL